MLKVVCVVDKQGTALDRLAKGVIPYHKNIDYHVVDVHPKRPDPEQLARFEELARTADIIDAQYYRSMDMLRQRYEWLKDIPTILTHNNPYAIHERDWNDYQVNVGNNKTIATDLGKITSTRVEQIPIVVDPFFWVFNPEYKYDRSVIMVANRIESKKGILPVALACKKLGIKMYLVGAISSPDYWKEVMDTGVVEFAQQCSDEELRALYYKAGIHVCNSVDNFESGTMPILEAIFCGVPVLTRLVGHVPDFKTDDNLVIQDSDPEDVDHIAELLHQMLSDNKKLDTMRNEAWMSIKERNFEWRAYMYQRLYREMKPGKTVSIIVPLSGREDVTRECLNAIANQTHQNIELIVVDDGEEDQKQLVDEFAATISIPVRYMRLGGKGYHLAKARNLAAIEATSDILVFCDQRMVMEPNAVEVFVENLKPRYWLYGSKGAKKDFVENFSCIYRDDFFTLGGFNERITMYGGMSQEVRSRARRQLVTIEYIEQAKATAKGKSSNRRTKKYEILQMKNMLRKTGMQ
jgi:glycosyltransferase involved in cell wall biosynthesis